VLHTKSLTVEFITVASVDSIFSISGILEINKAVRWWAGLWTEIDIANATILGG